MGGIIFKESPGAVHPLGIPDIVLPEPEDEIQIFCILLNEEEPFLEILET